MQFCHVLEKLELEHLTNGTNEYYSHYSLEITAHPNFQGTPGLITKS